MKAVNKTAYCSYAFRNISAVNLISILWDFIFIIYKFHYCIG